MNLQNSHFISVNKRAYFNYRILELYEAGIKLLGCEVKSIRAGRINLSGAYAIVKDSQVWLLNADVPSYQPKNAPVDYEAKRSRLLLLKKSEIKHLIGSLHEKGLTLVPLKVYTKNHHIKVELGLGRSRRKRDKRELIKKREAEKEMRSGEK